MPGPAPRDEIEGRGGGVTGAPRAHHTAGDDVAPRPGPPPRQAGGQWACERGSPKLPRPQPGARPSAPARGGRWLRGWPVPFPAAAPAPIPPVASLSSLARCLPRAALSSPPWSVVAGTASWDSPWGCYWRWRWLPRRCGPSPLCARSAWCGPTRNWASGRPKTTRASSTTTRPFWARKTLRPSTSSPRRRARRGWGEAAARAAFGGVAGARRANRGGNHADCEPRIESEIGAWIRGRGPVGAAAGLEKFVRRRWNPCVDIAPGQGGFPLGRLERGSGSGSPDVEGPPPPRSCIRREGEEHTKEEFVQGGLLATEFFPTLSVSSIPISKQKYLRHF